MYGSASNPKSSGQTDCCKEGSTLTEETAEVVSSESADMRGGGSKE